MVVECALGVLSSQFYFLMRRMMLSPPMASLCIQAACVLHNYLLKDLDPFVQEVEAKLQKYLKDTCDLNISGLAGVPQMCGFHAGMEARAVRNIFASYFTSREGHVPWQDYFAYVDDLED